MIFRTSISLIFIIYCLIIKSACSTAHRSDPSVMMNVMNELFCFPPTPHAAAATFPMRPFIIYRPFLSFPPTPHAATSFPWHPSITVPFVSRTSHAAPRPLSQHTCRACSVRCGRYPRGHRVLSHAATSHRHPPRPP